MSRNNDRDKFEEKVVRVSRVSTKTKGGDQFSFTVMMVVGDRKGRVGVGLGKAQDVVTAIRKGVRRAKKQMIDVPIAGTTVPFAMEGKEGAGRVLLKPASEGSGVIAGGPVRAVCEAAGIKDISAKILGSDNQASSVLATMKAFRKMNHIIKVRGIDVEAKKEEKDKPSKQKSSGKFKPKKAKSKTVKKAEKKSKKTETKESAKKSEKSEKKEPKKSEQKAKKSKAEKSTKKTKKSKKKASKSKSTKSKKKTEKKSDKSDNKTKSDKSKKKKSKSAKAKKENKKDKAKDDKSGKTSKSSKKSQADKSKSKKKKEKKKSK